MEKKTVFLELPCEMVDKIDQINQLGDRSVFVTKLLEKQLQHEANALGFSTDIMTRMDTCEGQAGISGEVSLVNSMGVPLGKFDINTMKGFEDLSQKIAELSDDPVVKTKAMLF